MRLASAAIPHADTFTGAARNREEQFAGAGHVPMAPFASTGARVLVVEDEPTVARLIADVLEDEGMRVDVMLDGREALEFRVEELTEKVHAVLQTQAETQGELRAARWPEKTLRKMGEVWETRNKPCCW